MGLTIIYWIPFVFFGSIYVLNLTKYISKVSSNKKNF